MLAKGWGWIINISSINGQRGQLGQTNYSVAKAGIHGFTMALAREVSGKSVTVNTISPGCRDKASWQFADLDLIEANEAFAAQALAFGKQLGWDASKVNVNGGAIALGHPIGASGCRVVVTLLHEMIRRDAKRGLVTLCIGGGQGVALTLER